MSGRGIDYGRGLVNIDRANGIRYGVIPMNDLSEWAHESFEPDYGAAHCPNCGHEAVGGDSEIPEQTECANCREAIPCRCEPPTDRDSTRDDLGYEVLHHACGDFACDDCCLLFDAEAALGGEVCEWVLDDGEYKATQNGDDSDVFILLSPFYTRAQFCSPCAPGACHLSNPTDDGDRAYCFGHDWFDGDKAPYPVYSVATGELVNPPVK